MRVTDLPGGTRVVTERMDGQRAVALGVWVATGSRDEPDGLHGGAHFLEHLVFKGTPSRSALQIAESFDAVGGDINAYTTKESTCFHSRTLGPDLPLVVETIADMLLDASCADGDFAAERSVVLDEIAMHEEAPEDLVFDLHHEQMFGEHALGRRVQGLARTVASISVADLRAFFHSRYSRSPAVVAAAGDVEHDHLVDLLGRAFAGAGPVAPPRVAPVPQVAAGLVTTVERDVEQVHLALGAPGPSRTDERRFALWVANVALGGGLSSRLFQEIRERRGLAYSVSSGYQSFTDAGLVNVYAACSVEHAPEVLALARAGIAGLAREGLTEAEFHRAVGHLRGSILLSLDEPGSLISHLGKSLLYMGTVMTPEEVIARIEAVTPEEVAAAGEEIYGGEWSLCALGPRGFALGSEAA